MSLADLLGPYLAGPELLRRATADLSVEQFDLRPIHGMWTVREVVCHLSDVEWVYADRLKRILAEERPLLLAMDENAWTKHLAYQHRDLADELAGIELARRQVATILRHAPPEALERLGVHSYSGLKTADEVVRGATNHLLHHLRFVQEKRRAMGMPETS